MTIGEVSRRTGVTIRTLRHYDRIGLLTPAAVTEAGYRLYDEAALQRLYMILLFRELELPLEEIGRILDHPDHEHALCLQETLLKQKRAHIDHLISLTQTIRQKGMIHMDFSAFDTRRQEDFTAQAEAAWGDTPAWQEYAQREKSRKPGDNARAGEALMALIGEFGQQLPEDPAAPRAQAFVAQLQQFITSHFYTCTLPVLRGLADMYETPEFRRSIDRAGREGTAAFLAQAIRIFCTRAQ